MLQKLLRMTSLATIATVVFAVPAFADQQTQSINVSVSSSKVERGGSVEVTIKSHEPETVYADLLRPTRGVERLALRKAAGQAGVYLATVDIDQNAPSGLYVVHAWTGDRQKPISVAKGIFRVGNIVADYFIANYLDKEKPADDLSKYLGEFRSIGGNFLVAHNLIASTGAFYPSKITRSHSTIDIVELVLDRADREGIPVLLSVSWDMTRDTPYKGRMKEIKSIATEMYELYGHHPSLAGFYSYQEGSGTYFAPYVREFSEHVKSLDRGLLTACAPHIDDPLLASYLSVIDELDIMIYQSAVMASYRPDNRKEYPVRRVHDFSGLGAGAKRLQKKIVLTHVELFAYMEKRLKPDILTASYDDIYGQILSAATVTDTDGIALFTYQVHIYDQSKKYEYAAKGRAAVTNGLKAYQAITSRVSADRNPLALYIPYSDFVIERWNNHFLPALDSFRRLGVPIDILPYAPAMTESVYPYYPFHMNEDVLERLLKDKTVLVLANVSGFQQTDSDLIKSFVERGGVVVAFGRQIPFGRSYERDELFGAAQIPDSLHKTIVVKAGPDKQPAATGKVRFAPASLPSWKAGGAKVIAEYEDGSAAVLMNSIGKGKVYTISPDSDFASRNFPYLVQYVLSDAMLSSGHGPLVPITGMDENMDLAVRDYKNGMTAAIINHNDTQRRLTLQPGREITECSSQNGNVTKTLTRTATTNFNILIPKDEAVIVECR